MSQLFGIQLDTWTSILLVITAIIIGGVLLLALGNTIFFKIGVRNIPRRRMQMVLIVFALMLSTTLLSSVLATGDVITGAVQSVAVYNLGNVDETIEPRHGSFFDDSVYYGLLEARKNYPDIAAIGAALSEGDLLVADTTSRQVRSKVTALAIIPDSEEGFGGMQNDTGRGRLRIADLQPNAVYLNHTLALLLNARPGDTIYIYAKHWPGRRYEFHIQAIAGDGGLAGAKPYILSQAITFRTIENRHDDITDIYISNRGAGGVDGVAFTDNVISELYRSIPGYLRVSDVKQDGLENSQKAQDIFSRIFTLFCLFSLAIGLLLIFLIFVLLAAERRAEMGMARAIGVQRGQLVLMFLFEGTVYDLLASFAGLAIGVGVGAVLVTYLGPILARFNFPLALTFRPRSLVIAYCLGVIFTFFSVAVSSWLVSRMTVVDAMRNLPESERPALSPGEIVLELLLLKHIPDALISLVRLLVLTGLLPLIAGYGLLRYGLQNFEIVPFSLGFSLLVIGAGLLLKTLVERVLFLFGTNQRSLLQRIFATVAGLALVAYWAMPFDTLAQLGLPRFQGGIEVFFVASVMMVLGATWALVANADLLVNPLLKLSSWFSWIPGLHLTARLASAYPLHHRFRTGLSVVMFSLVIFAMTVMATITNAMQNNYTNFDVQTGGYDIQGIAYFKSIPDIRPALVQHGIDPASFSEIGVRTTTAAGVIQPGAKDPAWRLYPAQIVDGGFLQGYGLRLVARAKGFDSDSAVWQGMQSHPNYALIDDDALPYPPNYLPVYDPNAPAANDAGSPNTPPGFDPYYTFSLSGVYQGDASFAPTTVWVSGLDRATAIKLTIIGVVDNSDSAHYGLYISKAAYVNAPIDPYIAGVLSNAVPNQDTPEAQAYYFKVAPGQDKRALALALGSAFLDNGFETTVLEDAVWQLRGPRILISDILLGMVGMVLLFGVAALAITGTRAVIERRQQIGMLRALGGSRRLLQGAFLCESFLVGCVGGIAGVVLGLILCHNIFAVNFFEQFNTGLAFAIPWDQLTIIVGVALAASLLAALLPAWQAGRVTPTEALRY
jgi:putative ABC transport system permease protein